MSRTALPLSSSAPPPPRPRRPLLVFAGLFLGGALLGGWFEPQVDVVAGMFVPVLVVAVTRTRRVDGRVWATWVLVFLLGMLRAAVSSDPQDAGQLTNLMDRPYESMMAEVDVVSEPFVSSHEEETDIVRCSVRVRRIRRGLSWQDARALADLRWEVASDVADKLLAYGQRWQWHVRVTDYTRNPPRWHVKHDCAMEVTGLEAEQLAGFHGSRFLAMCQSLRRSSAEALARGLSSFPEQVGLLKALLLGYRQDLPDEREESFARTGTLHVFAISGLHVGIISMLLIAAVQAMGTPRRFWIFVVGPALILYTVTTGMKASAVRACIMALAYGSSSWLWRKPDVLSALALAAVCIVAAAPDQVSAPGFILSFTVVLSILVLFPRLYAWFSSYLAADFGVNPHVLSKRESWLRDVRLYVAGLAAMSVAAWAGSMPLSASFFNLCSPIALVANLLVIPATFAVVFSGCLSLLTVHVSPWMCEVFNSANLVLVSTLLWCIDRFREWPMSWRFVASPPWIWTVAWYVLLVLSGCASHRRWRRWAALGMVVLFVALWWGWLAPTPRQTCLDAYGGVTLVVQNESRAAMVLCGDLRRHDVVELTRGLRRLGVSHVHTLVVSRPDGRTAVALSNLCSTVQVDRMLLPSTPVLEDEARHALVEQSDALSVEVQQVSAGEQGLLPGGLAWEVLYPPARASLVREMTPGFVARVGANASSTLYMGSAGSGVEDAIRVGGRNPGATVLVCGFSVDRFDLSPPWLDLVGCEKAIVHRGGRRAVRGHHRSNVRNLQDVGVSIVFTERHELTPVRGAPGTVAAVAP